MFRVDVIVNETGEVIETEYFRNENEKNGWLTYRRTMMDYGPDFERDFVVKDVTDLHLKKLDVVDRSEDREFGLHIIDVIAAFNKKHKSAGDMQTIFATPAYVAIILSLLTGALETARSAMSSIGPMLYPADFVAQVLGAMDAQIALSAPEPESEEPAPEEDEDSDGTGGASNETDDEENEPEV